jgi:dTDP-4-dehydrorhamnose reductase
MEIVASMSEISPRVLVTGACGQLGRALLSSQPDGTDVWGCDLNEFDITDPAAVSEAVLDFSPDVIINAAAYTAVDRAEDDRDRAFEVNAGGAENLARAAAACSSRLIYVSTDYVFSGLSGTPYRPLDTTEPVNTYAESKLEGERRTLVVLGQRGLVLRTAWLYAAAGRNFVTSVLRLIKRGDPIRVVDDQIGTPTWATTLSGALWGLCARPSTAGVYHYTEAGVASWYDFALAIQEEALALRLLDSPVEIQPIPSREYPTRARRPLYSVLDKSDWIRLTGQFPPHWRVALRRMLMELVELGVPAELHGVLSESVSRH